MDELLFFMTITHRKSRTRTYGIWQGMLNRCRNPRVKDYDLYGARGISVCRRWLRFEAFFEDMGAAPIGHSLDRVDSKRNYGPFNCRWATPKQQARNMSRNLWFEFEGRRVTVAELSELTGIQRGTLQWRIHKGLPREDVLRTTRLNSRRVSLKQSR